MAMMTKDHEKLWFDFLHHVTSTRGRFGCEEERVWPCMIGPNEKGGMNDEEFDKYIDNSIVSLYPDLEDTLGKRVLLKVDSGPGCNGRDLLNKARFRGIPFSWPSKRHLRAAGDGYELWSVQVCRPLQPQKHRHGQLLGQEVEKVGAVYLRFDRIRRGLSGIESCV